MSLSIDKPWQPRETHQRLPGHMGVFELADRRGRVVFVGEAGGRSRFGLRSEVAQAFSDVSEATQYRFEVTTAYQTRYQELLMLHQVQQGELPRCSRKVATLGRLSPHP